MRLLLYLALLLSSWYVAAQNYPMHDNNWIFGYSDGQGNSNGTLLYFENGYPEFTNQNIQQDYGPYCIVCSDSSGNLLFHTNGIKIRNRLHEVMENGGMINPGLVWNNYQTGSYPSITGGLTIPAPGHLNFYYMIHTTLKDYLVDTILCPELLYSLIDMNANNGLGKVVAVNQVIATGDLVSPVIVKHGNGRDWWLIAGNAVSNTYLIYLIDPSGIHLVNSQNALGSLASRGYAKASVDGRFFVSNDIFNSLWIFDFDRCAGILSKPRKLPYQFPDFFTTTIAFSPDDRFLYLGTTLVVYQLDLKTIDNPVISLDTIARHDRGFSPSLSNFTVFLLPELAPDDKVYYTTFNYANAFHVINYPKLPLLTADFEQRGLILPVSNDWTRCYFPNYRLGRCLDSPCDTLPFAGAVEDRYQHLPWEAPKYISGVDTVRVLKLPPGFHPPEHKTEEIHGDFDPLSIKYLQKQAMQRRSQEPAIQISNQAEKNKP